jgi:hypothetical protein
MKARYGNVKISQRRVLLSRELETCSSSFELCNIDVRHICDTVCQQTNPCERLVRLSANMRQTKTVLLENIIFYSLPVIFHDGSHIYD